MFFSKRWNPAGLVSFFPTQIAQSNKPAPFKHCYVTGGSQGLGLSLAILLAKRGAHVSIVARTQSKLNEALSILEVRHMLLLLIAFSHLLSGIQTKP